jgi:hypothetical protein
MSALEQAKAPLAKAREFLEAAHLSNDLELYSAATSNAVIAGINAKDALCLKLKARSQYQSAPVAATDAAKAVDWAGRMVDGAIKAVIG